MEKECLKISIKLLGKNEKSNLHGFHGILYRADGETIVKEKFGFSKQWLVDCLGNYAKEFNKENERKNIESENKET